MLQWWGHVYCKIVQVWFTIIITMQCLWNPYHSVHYYDAGVLLKLQPFADSKITWRCSSGGESSRRVAVHRWKDRWLSVTPMALGLFRCGPFSGGKFLLLAFYCCELLPLVKWRLTSINRCVLLLVLLVLPRICCPGRGLLVRKWASRL